MNKSVNKKTIALIMTFVTIILILSLLMPSLSAVRGGKKSDGISIGYGYGGEDCTRTQGYWKNHPNDWPVEEIIIGGILYTKEQAIDILKTPVKEDMTIAMFYQLAAAMLNVYNGAAYECIDQTIDDSDDWMTDNPLGSGVEASSEAWDIGEPLKDLLDDYNNGLMCAPHCD